jgi:uncharacterized membrane protein
VLKLRRAWVVLVGAWVGAASANVLFNWILGLDGVLPLILALVAAVLGALAALGEARRLEPWTLWDQRDAYLGWVTFFGIVAVIASLFIPMPWGGVAAVAVAAVTVVVLRKAPPAPASGAPRSGDPV